MQVLAFNHFSPPRYAYVSLYNTVNDPGSLKKRIIAASKAGPEEQAAVNFSFVDASLITSSLHLQTAIHQALLAESQNGLRTQTVHSEILWALNPTNNISEAIRRYGVSDSTKALITVHITDVQDIQKEVQEKLDAVVDGTSTPFDRLEDITNWDTISKLYKLDKSLDKALVDNVVTSNVAMKSVAS